LRARLRDLFARPDAEGGGPTTPKPSRFEETTVHVKPLPGAWEEGERIATLLRTTACFGEEADREQLQQAPAPTVLHLAVPAFCLSDVAPEPSEEGVPEAGAAPAQPFPAARWQNPLRRVGLVLAGAASASPATATDRGLLTAHDVSD